MLAQVIPAEGWAVIQALSVILALALAGIAFVRQVGGKGGERQIEPTQLAAISDKIDAQGEKLDNINREIGEVRTEVKTRVDSLDEQMLGMHTRVGGISRELAGTTARVEILERTKGGRHA